MRGGSPLTVALASDVYFLLWGVTKEKLEPPSQLAALCLGAARPHTPPLCGPRFLDVRDRRKTLFMSGKEVGAGRRGKGQARMDKERQTGA